MRDEDYLADRLADLEERCGRRSPSMITRVQRPRGYPADMGLLDGILGGPRYTPAPVPVEGVIGRWTAARTSSGLAIAGGEVVLTPEYLVFTPWDMTQTRAFLVKLLSSAGVPHVGDVDKLLTASKLLEPIAVHLSQLTLIQPLGRASVLKPPYARITFDDGRHLDLGILAGPLYPNFSPANNAAFDDWLAKIRAALAALR